MNARLSWRRLPARVLDLDAGLRSNWDRLNRSGLDLPFLDSDAICAALEEFGSGGEVLLCGHEDGRDRAMLLLAAAGRLRWSTFQPSQIPLGSWVAEAGLAPQELARQALSSRCLGSLASVLSLTQIDPMQSMKTHDDSSCRHDDYIPTAWLEISGNFEEYWAARGKNLRQNLRKQRTKLESDGVVVEFMQLREPEEVAPALDRYGALESSGWKAGEGTAIHPDNEQGRFYKRLLEQAARRRETLICEYRFNGRTVAMNLGLLRSGTWVVLKTAYDESVAKSFSPASLLREAELREFFQATGVVQRIEYYGRVMDWHTKLTAHQRTLYHLTCYRWAWLKRLADRRRRALARNAEASPGYTE